MHTFPVTQIAFGQTHVGQTWPPRFCFIVYFLIFFEICLVTNFFLLLSQAFLNNFQAAQAAVYEASAAAAAVAKQNAKEAYTKATRMSLDIELKASGDILFTCCYSSLFTIIYLILFLCVLIGSYSCGPSEFTKF